MQMLNMNQQHTIQYVQQQPTPMISAASQPMQSTQMPCTPLGVMQPQTQTYMPQLPQLQYQQQTPTMQEQLQPTPLPQPQSSSSPSWETIDFNAMWNNLLPGKYSVLTPEFRSNRRQRDVRVYEKYLPLVIEFLEAWENVPKNVQPQWYQSALASYTITDRLKWIFEQDRPQDCIQPMPDAKIHVIFEQPAPTPHGTYQGSNAVPYYMPSVQPYTPQQSEQNSQKLVIQSPQPTGEAAPAASVPPAWQSYVANSSQPTEPSADAAASSWQRPSQSSWQLNSGTQNWGNQSQGSSWQSSSYQGSTTEQRDAWWNSKQNPSEQNQPSPSQQNQPSPSEQKQHSSGVQNHPNPSAYNINTLINDGNFAKANFTAGKLRRLLPRARDHRNAPDPEFEVKFSDEAMTHMFSFNSGELPVWAHPVMYSTWLPPSLQLEKISGLRNPTHARFVTFVNHEMLCALTYFMRNPKNWSVESNAPAVILDNGTTEQREDVRFKIGVEPVYSVIPMHGVPRGKCRITL
eukprot:3137160-Amphidinium_carterae.3